VKYISTDSLKRHFASSFGSCLDDIDRIWTAAMLGICHFEQGGKKQGASCLFTAANAVAEIIENYDNLGSTGDDPEGLPQLNRQLNRQSGRYSHVCAVPT
jgi:hypothetical protein